MGDACGGIFSLSHGFLAASRWNYLLAAAIATIFMLELAFLIGGGARLFWVTHNHKKRKNARSSICPALLPIAGKDWAGRIFFTSSRRLEAQTVGLFKPRIVLSCGLIDNLTGDELRAVVSHEEAHCSGRDNVIVAVAKSMAITLFYLPGQKMAFHRMRSCLEMAADMKVARVLGSRLLVAQALARIAKVSHAGGREPAVAMSVSGGGDLTGRLEALVKGRGPSRHRCRHLALFMVLAAAALAFFSTNALAVASTDQRGAFTCFSEHQHDAGPNGVCEIDHPGHASQ